MTKLTYKEQLLHPNWQRRRLEILQRDAWSCTRCGATDKTLHVHHKLYVKGRLAWEYPDADLASVCVDCHAEQHEHDAELQRLMAEGPTSSLLALCRGFVAVAIGDPAKEALYDSDSAAFAGYVAATLMHLSRGDAMQVEQLVHTLFMADVG